MAAFLALCAANASAQLNIGAGAEFTTGKFGTTETTNQLYVPFTAKLETGRWTLKATVPYLFVSGPANVIGGGEDRVPISNSGSGSGSSGSGSGGSGSGGSGSGGGGGSSDGDGQRTASGLGDIVTSLSYALFDEQSRGIGLDVGGRVKFGTADVAERLGTGENDFSVQMDLYKAFGGLTAFATLGYRWYGDPPGITLRDVPFWALGASYRLGGGSTIGAAYDHRPPIVAGSAAISEGTVYWSKRFASGWRLQLYAIVGFSDGSPDAGAGSFVEYRF